MPGRPTLSKVRTRGLPEPSEQEFTVAVDSRLCTEPTGIGRYVRSLLPELIADGSGAIVETHRPRRVDVFHAPSLQSALLRSPVPMVVTLHDLTPLKRRGEFLRTGLSLRLHYLAAQRAVRIIVPTEAVAADAVEHLRFERSRISVIGEAAAAVFTPRSADQVARVRERHGLPERYLLWVGSLERPEPRKRVAGLADAPRRLPLVLVGRAGRWARELPDVQLTGEVSDDDLAAIYSGAHSLVFPSEDEGFGLPLVEALACGTPVVACDLPVLREVHGDRVTFVAPGDLAGLIAAGEAATRPAPILMPWSWTDVARATWQVYREAATASGGATTPS